MSSPEESNSETEGIRAVMMGWWRGKNRELVVHEYELKMRKFWR